MSLDKRGQLKRFILPVLGFVLLGTSFQAWASTVKLRPFIFVKQEYTNNSSVESNNKEEDHITTITGGLKVLREGERFSASAGGQMNRLFYQENDTKNTTDNTLSGNIAFQATERFSTNVYASYSQDSRNDADTDTTGLRVSGDRDSTEGGMGFSYQLSELSSAGISLDYTQSDIDGDEHLEDSEIISMSCSSNRNLHNYFANTTGIISLSYNHYSTETEDITSTGLISTAVGEFDSDVFQLTAGFTKALNEIYNFSFQAGATYSDRSERSRTRITSPSGVLISEIISPEITDNSIDGVFSATLNYADEYNRFSLSIDESMKSGTGTSGAVLRSSVSGQYSRQFSEKFSLNLSVSCFLNQNDRETTSDTDTLTFTIQPGAKYEFDKNFILTCSYKFSSVEDMEDSTTSEQNTVFVALRKEFEI